MMGLAGLRVVIAEDDFLVGAEVQRIAESLGCVVAGVARDGEEAVELVRALRPGAAILDVQMGKVSGVEAARRIRDECPVPVVILTAYDSPELVGRATDAGVGAYLTKPPDRGELLRAISVAVARFADQAELRRVNEELQKALSEVKTLTGLLPMCAFCKRIFNEEGYWQAVESYIASRTPARISHGFCRECAVRHYPEEFGGEDGEPEPGGR